MCVSKTYGVLHYVADKRLSVTFPPLQQRRPLKFSSRVLHHGGQVAQENGAVTFVGQDLLQVAEERGDVPLHASHGHGVVGVDGSPALVRYDRPRLQVRAETGVPNAFELVASALKERLPGAVHALAGLLIQSILESAIKCVESLLVEN